MEFKGAIFDLDGTLLDSMHVWKKVDIAWFVQNGIEYDSNVSHAFKNMTFFEAANYVIKLFNLSKSAQDIMDEWDKMVLFEYRDNIKLKPFVLEYLNKLKKSGVKMSIATSCLKNCCTAALKSNGILNYFDDIVYSNDIGKGKSYPDIYLYCANIMGIEPKDCVVFEDIYHAINGVRAANMRFVGVYDNFSSLEWDKIKQEADLCITSFEELL